MVDVVLCGSSWKRSYANRDTCGRCGRHGCWWSGGNATAPVLTWSPSLTAAEVACELGAIVQARDVLRSLCAARQLLGLSCFLSAILNPIS